MRILFISFQKYDNYNSEGMIKLILPIIDVLSKYKPVEYWVSSARNYEGKLNIRAISKLFVLVIKISMIFKNRFKLFKSSKIRLFMEVVFDFIASIKLKEPSIIISTAYLNKTLVKNKSLGGVNIFIAGNPDDKEIYYLLKREEKKYDLNLDDVYTYKKRLDFISLGIYKYDHLITVTKTELETYKMNIDCSKISYCESYVIPDLNVFDINKLKKNDKFTFCYIAHTVWLKGLTYLIEAWQLLDIDSENLIIGGRIDENVNKYIKKNYGKLKNVEFVGHVQNISEFYSRADVCIIPSLLDAGPTTIFEAMYHGLPVITTEGCGSKSLVKNDFNGFIVDIADSKAIAQKIKWFINNKDKTIILGENARETVLNISSKEQSIELSRHILKCIDNLIKDKQY